jgi:signal transduction histidine kinase
VAITAAALAGTLAQLSHGGLAGFRGGGGELDWTSAALAAGSTVPLLAWRRAPRAVFAFTASVSVLLGGLGYPLTVPLGPTAALYLLAASRAEEPPWPPRAVSGVVLLFTAYLVARGADAGHLPWNALLHTGLAWAVAWFAGERTRLRRAHVADLQERASRAEREGERERRLAVAEERARIARDLHDAAGHAINVIALRAGTARLRRDPERSQDALEAIEELARRTVGEIDQIVGTLRDPAATDGTVDAPHGLASLDTLVSRHTAAGLDVRVMREGERRQLEGPVDQAAYRILQEGLTNAARHGTGAAHVHLAFDDAELQLTITNPVRNGVPGRRTNGHGMIGMRERATLVGGSLDADRTDGVFRLSVHLPYGDRPA